MKQKTKAIILAVIMGAATMAHYCTQVHSTVEFENSTYGTVAIAE